MTVYILLGTTDWEGDEILGVYTTPERAETHRATLDALPKYDRPPGTQARLFDSFSVQEYAVDEQPACPEWSEGVGWS